MKKFLVVFFVVMFINSTAWACSKPDCQHQSQETNVDTAAIGIADSTAISTSAAIVGVNSENKNINVNTPQGGQGGNSNVSTENNSTNIANGGLVEVGGINNQGDTIATAGPSSAVNDVVIGDQIATSGDSISSVGPIDNSSGSSYSEGSQAYSGGNSMKNIYNNVQKLDSYNTYLRVRDVEYSTDNISGAVNYQDNGWEHPSAGIEVRYTHAFGTGPAKKALDYEVNRMEAEKQILDAQVKALGDEKKKAEELHTLALNKAQMEIALLCEPFLKELTAINNTPASEICKNYTVKNPITVEKIVEVPVVKTKVIYRDKVDPCEKCAKKN